MSQMSPTLTARPLILTKKSTMDQQMARDFLGRDAVNAPELIGACGLPVEPLEPSVIRQWESEVNSEQSDALSPIRTPRVDGASQAELSGFEDDDEVGGGDAPADGSDDDEFDDFDDIDEDDFDDDFDDDFEEELDDDYEIEIEDEISAEFGLSGVEIEIDDVEDIDAIDVIDVIDEDIVADDTPDKE